MTSKITNIGVLVFLLIPATQSIQKKSFDIDNTSSTKYPVYSYHTIIYHELSSNKTGAAVLTRSDEKYYNKRVLGRDQFEENKTSRRSDNLWISEDKTKGTAKEEKIKDKNISSRSNKIRAVKDLRVTFDEGGRTKRFAHSRFMKVGDKDNRYPPYMSPEFFNSTLESLLREMLLKQKILDVRTRMEQSNTVWDMKFKLAILFLIMGFLIALFAGPKIIKFRFRRIDPDDEKTCGNVETERCKSSMKNKKRIAYFDTFLEKLRAHYRRKSESNSRLGDRASKKSLNVEMNKIESERKPLLTDIRHIQPPPKSHSSSLLTKIYSRSVETPLSMESSSSHTYFTAKEVPLSMESSSSHTYFTAKEVPSVDRSDVAPSGSSTRGKLVSSSHISGFASENVSSSAPSRSKEKVTSTIKSSACPSTDSSTSTLRESGSSLFSVVPIMKQINFLPSESKYPVPSEIRYQKGPTLSENQASSPSGRNSLVVSSINNTDDHLKGQVMTEPNSQMARESGSEETLYEQPTKFTLGKFYGSRGKRVYFHIKSQKKKSEDTK